MKCNFTINKIQSNKEILSGYIIAKNLQKQILTNNCYTKNEIMIHGNNIIKFKNCKIAIGNSKFDNQREVGIL